MKRFVPAALLLALACTSCRSRPPTGPGPIVDLQTDVIGLSGLTRDGDGKFWAAGENGDAIIRIDPATFAVHQYPVVGAPKGADLEGLTWIGGRRFLIGTETQVADRSSDVLLDGRVVGDRFVVSELDRINYRDWNLSAPDNRGMEGLCHVDGFVILATELVDEQRGKRWAPVAMRNVHDKTWSKYRVALSSDTGKLAALGCRVVDGKVVALAVERHFGVCRLLRFELPREQGDGWIEPEVAADLSSLIKPLPNFEGIVWDDDGSVVLLTDNYYRGRTKDASRLYFVPASVLE